jgi:ketosteroid isomerase-like protein
VHRGLLVRSSILRVVDAFQLWPQYFTALGCVERIVGLRLGLLGNCTAALREMRSGFPQGKWSHDMVRTIVLAACMAMISVGAVGQEPQVTEDQYEELQKNFAEAYNRKDVDAMANAFTEDAIRVTPSGMFAGRDAIRRNLQDVVAIGLHDYTVQRTTSRSVGSFVFNAGEWRAKLGDQPLQATTPAIVIRDGDRAKIMEETVTVAAPGQ